jgi:hypothetical protein
MGDFMKVQSKFGIKKQKFVRQINQTKTAEGDRIWREKVKRTWRLKNGRKDESGETTRIIRLGQNPEIPGG